VDVRAPFGGVLSKQLAGIDESVLVGAPLFTVNKTAGGAPAAAAAAAPVEASKPAAAAAVSAGEELVTVNVPSMGDSISEGTVVTVLKSTLVIASVSL
jgi:2-oxoglutarate dehydrogenase E2 component (dihydrolipoamide succinyltransferase)